MVSLWLAGLAGSSKSNAFEQAPLGGGTTAAKLVYPLGGRAFDLQGTDSHKLAIGPFPSAASQDLAERQRGRLIKYGNSARSGLTRVSSGLGCSNALKGTPGACGRFESRA